MEKKYGVLKYVTNEDLKLLETNPEKFWCDVTEISNKAFHDYTRLTFIIIPGCVTKIGVEAFSECNNLKEMILSKRLVLNNSGAFEDFKEKLRHWKREYNNSPKKLLNWLSPNEKLARFQE